MNTVNVIEIADTNNMAVQQLVAFYDDVVGNQKAEQLFKQLVQENSTLRDMEIEVLIEDGYFEQSGYWVGIVHSTPQPKLVFPTVDVAAFDMA